MPGVEFCVEETITGTEAAQIPKQRGDQLLDSAVRYAEERHWDVFPGTWLEAAEGVEHCSCGDAACPSPGAHPSRPDWATQATGSAVAARRLWSKQPKASILLPTGRTFDAIDVPESAGFLALARMERMELTLGPVTCTPDRRMLFFVLPGAGAKVPDLVRKLGWTAASIDLITRGEGDYVAAPPTRIGGHGAVQWARRPTPANRWLPDAEELISPLAYACGREAAAARARRS
ncbi:bifunctional DNA primase/polymerase [Streptomyces sp. TLI_146]|uniref:bifunctional DNA primase/polymerase n=1 Tax=Streptomyces sp. TLI_146 TaxID=1938858 RepID=UPI000C7158C1|nr:bifunctional DNA primase/polymerase [Streptomyces sp. TLI_146]PKV86364.1 bifunctional DNA primase/polymerase-like protein [Streptomyces sp. TLI_146]